MAKEYKKVSVFIDTNILQSFIKYSKKDYVFLANLGIPKNYYNLVSFIEENRFGNCKCKLDTRMNKNCSA